MFGWLDKMISDSELAVRGKLRLIDSAIK